MKKIIIVLAVLILLGGTVFAQEEQGPVRVDFSSGLYYDAYTLPDLGGFEFLAAIINLRVGGFMGLGFNPNEFLTVGAEAGALAMYWENSTGYYTTLFDLPFHAYADVHLGEFIALRAYGGGVALGTISSAIDINVVPEAGARLSLGGLYAEVSYVFTATPFQRYGIGFTSKAF